MIQKNIFIIICSILAIIVAGYFFFLPDTIKGLANKDLDSNPRNIILEGVFECLPHENKTGVQTDECAFGLRTDDEKHYAVNFGQSAQAMQQFQAGARIKAEGFFVTRMALSDSMWMKYEMEGLFTITRMIEPTPSAPSQAKLNIDVVCRDALTFMTFMDSASAELFVTECKEGKHPEVIDQYKVRMGIGEGAQI